MELNDEDHVRCEVQKGKLSRNQMHVVIRHFVITFAFCSVKAIQELGAQ